MKTFRTAGLLALFVFHAAAFCQTNFSLSFPQRFDSLSEWHPPGNFRQMLDRRCAQLSGGKFQQCFINLAGELGASREALLFISMTDTTGYVRHFADTGIVDVVYVCYPFRANENFGVVLVSGKPGMINVDDFSFVDLGALKRNPAYRRIIHEFPDASVWPGDRYDLSNPKHETLADGTHRFEIEYRLQNGCHACERIGTATFAFDFDGTGKFLGTSLLNVREGT